jgi:hypothetical protein
VLPFFLRVLTATPSLQIDRPVPVLLSSGSLVKFPVSTTRLMFILWLLSRAIESLQASLGAPQAATPDLPGKWAETLKSGGEHG